MWRAARCFAASAALVFAGPAGAAPPIELRWEAPPGCPSRERVLSEVRRLVANAPDKSLRARASVTADEEGFRVRIELEGSAQGARTLRAQTCESVARATALIVALAIDPQAAAILSEQLEPQPPQNTAESSPPRSSPPARDTRGTQPAPATHDGVHPGFFAGFVAEQALVPVALGAEAGMSARFRGLRGDVAVGIVPGATATTPEHPGVSADFTLGFLALRACAGWVAESAALSGCAAVRGSLIWARGIGAPTTSEATAHVLSLEPGILARMPGALGIGAELAAHLVVPLNHPRFVVTEGGTDLELYRPASLGAMVALAVHYEL
jgi:hypothetical protein